MMTTDSPAERAVACIEATPELNLYFAAPPQAILMPFANEKQKRYITIVVFLIDQAINIDTLTFICTRLLQVLDREGVLRELDGVEIMPCQLNGGVTQRILRLSVLARGLNKAKSLETEQLKCPIPLDGITVHFYKKELAG